MLGAYLLGVVAGCLGTGFICLSVCGTWPAEIENLKRAKKSLEKDCKKYRERLNKIREVL